MHQLKKKNSDYLAGLPTNFFKNRLGMKKSDVSRLINCISQATNRLKGFNSEIHKLEHPPFDLGMAQKAINSLTNPQEKDYFTDVLYFVSDAKSPLNRKMVRNKKK